MILNQMGCPNATLEIINVEKNPDIIKRERIMAVPMLVNTSLIPERRFVGKFSNCHPNMLGATNSHST